MPSSRICILSLSLIRRDGRVLRQIEYAAEAYDVTVIGWGRLEKPYANVRVKPVAKWAFPPLQRVLQAALMYGGRFDPAFWERWYWRKPDHRQALQLLANTPCEVIHVNEAIALPIAVRTAAQTGARVLFDAHEYSPLQHENRLWWRWIARPFYDYLVRRYGPRADAMTTVGEGIAQAYQRNFGLNATVVMNAPQYVETPFHPVDPDQIRMVHHGKAMRERHLEETLKVLAQTDARYTLEFMLLDKDTGYTQKLKRLGRRLAPGRVTFRRPVPPTEIAATLNRYDVGLFLIPPVNFNYANALPNKFFEFVMAGLAIAIGPTPEMARIARRYGLGVVSDSFGPADMAKCLNALSARQINQMKLQSREAAIELNADTEMCKVLAIYEQLLLQGRRVNAKRDRAPDRSSRPSPQDSA